MPEQLSSHEEGAIKLALPWVAFFKSNQERFIEMLTSGNIVYTIMLGAYNVLVRIKAIETIETLQQEEKWEVFKQAQRWAPGSNKNKLIGLSKCIHALNYLKK